ncbi:hypothetical protein, partial [Mesorhizobium sp.]|uniref:hypothetical protein n=1 Tax=Mesorhizobium sp. TaxID=1871066 RepID=UPI0025E8F945
MLAVDLGDTACPDMVADAALELFPSALEEALAIAQALVLRIQAAVDEDRHANPSGFAQPALFTRMFGQVEDLLPVISFGSK